MRTVIPWHETQMELAFALAHLRSKDPNTQVGCRIVDDENHVISEGYNGFAAGAHESEELWKRPIKYDHVIHAENNAIGHAAKMGRSTKNATAYVTALPCLPCAKLLISAGIIRVYYSVVLNGWDEDAIKALKEFKRCNVVVIQIKV